MNRKAILLAASLLAACLMLIAPRDASALGWGVRGGLLGSNIVGEGAETKLKLGFLGGVALSVPAGPITIAPELLYVNAGYSYEFANVRYPATLGFATAEILVRYSIQPVPGLHVTAGPRVSYLLTGNIETPQGSGFDPYDFERFQYGLTGGVGYSFLTRYMVQARYSRDLSNLIAGANKPVSSQIISLVVGMSF
jgi:hypothetical protein